METGKGLNILIHCNYLPHHDWMTFAAWYSIIKNLPDAEVSIYCDRSKFVNMPIFSWAKKIPTIFSFKFSKLSFNLEIPCEAMAVRTWNGSEISEAKLDKNTTFCTYSECGDFVLSKWINSIIPPFNKTENFMSGVSSTNELRILELWKKVLPIYTAVV